METNNIKNKNQSNNIVMHIVIILFSLFVAVALTGGEIAKSIEYKKYQNANFVEVDATIVEYKEFGINNSTYYVTYFEYISHDGKTYIGFWSNDIYSKEEAEALLGSKIRLYYNDAFGVRKTIEEVNATKSVEKPNHIVGGIIVAALLLLAVNSLIKTILYATSNKQIYHNCRSNENEKRRN